MLAFFAIATILSSCEHHTRKGTSLSEADRNYIKHLGLLDDHEKIILFDGQSDFETSGNFFSDKRIASYWIDKRDNNKSSVNFGLYNEIDTILTKDLSRALTYASYLEVVKRDGTTFKVYVDGDSTQVWTFFQGAITAWKMKTTSTSTIRQ